MCAMQEICGSIMIKMFTLEVIQCNNYNGHLLSEQTETWQLIVKNVKVFELQCGT